MSYVCKFFLKKEYERSPTNDSAMNLHFNLQSHRV